MILSPEVVEAYRRLITDPKGHKLDFPALAEVFEKTEVATAKHILFEEYIGVVNRPVPKVIFYIIMDGLYPQTTAPDGNFGYCVKVADTVKT